MSVEPIQIECRIGPATDRLAYVTGISNSLSKQLANLRYQEIIPDPEMVDRKATYNLPLDAYFMGTRDKEPVYFYTTTDQRFERLTESEFLDRVYKRFEPCSVVQPIDSAKLVPSDDEEGEPKFEPLANWLTPSRWMIRTEARGFWRDTPQHYRVILRRMNGGWAALVLMGTGRETFQGPPRRKLEEAQVDAWLATLDLERAGWPVCANCGGQKFTHKGCVNGCGFEVVGRFPDCISCDDEPVFEPDRVMCPSCDRRHRKPMAD